MQSDGRPFGILCLGRLVGCGRGHRLRQGTAVKATASIQLQSHLCNSQFRPQSEMPFMISTAEGGRIFRPVLHPRICATLTVACCLVHLWLAAANHHGAWFSGLMIAIAAVCIPCSVHIWRHSRLNALHQVTVSSLAMVALHTFLLLGAGGAGHSHGGGPDPKDLDTSAATGLLLVIMLEIATAMIAATLVARLRRRSQLLRSISRGLGTRGCSRTAAS